MDPWMTVLIVGWGVVVVILGIAMVVIAARPKRDPGDDPDGRPPDAG
jgi:hypothetical protein